MGDLRPRATPGTPDGGRSRGQLLIVTALALAVLLSLLTVALNTAVFGGVHVAQADDAGREERAAAGYRDAVRRGVDGLIPAVNEPFVEYDTLNQSLRGEVGNWSDMAREEYARDGTATSASLVGSSFETRIVHNDTSDDDFVGVDDDFQDQSGSPDWTVAADVSDARGYDMEVNDDLLKNTPDCGAGTGCFNLTVEGANGGEWRMSVHDDSGVAIDVESANGTTYTCDTPDSSARINVSDGTFDGGPCTFASYREDPALDAPYTLRYTNANNVTGTFNLTVEGRLASTIGTDGNDGDDRYGTTGSPRLSPRIDGANVTVQYRTADLIYRTQVEVNETDD